MSQRAASPAPGGATPEGTRALAARFALPHGATTLGSTGLTASRVGFGCYRVDDRTPAHRAALEKALASGCTLIDTSTNYMDGASERLVGEVARGAPRDGIVVVSKIGYVQGRNLDVALERERRGAPFPEMVRYMEGCWHCIHPEFLEDQLARSLERLRMDRLDVCLLHNPEYFLSDAAKHGGDLERTRAEFYRRLREAFAWLEGAARRGRIGWYGVSSNTATAPAADPEGTDVARMLEAAAEAGGPDHRFRVLQIPLNLVESGGALTPNTGPGGGRTALEEAAARGVGVLINRPLNAIVRGGLLRLADGFPWSPAVRSELEPALPPDRRQESLSRLAIGVVAATPGVGTVLVGMRRPEYVDDALGVLARPPLADPLAAYRRFSGALRRTS